MKHLHKLFFTGVMMLSAIVNFNSAQAQRPVMAQRPALRDDAAIVIHRTRITIEGDQIAVIKGKIYTGDLARAIAHQHFARRLFLRGAYLRAIHQSLRARRLAFASIKANHAEMRAEWQLNAMEQNYSKASPADGDLDKEMEPNPQDAGVN